jgi:hypothetical protein
MLPLPEQRAEERRRFQRVKVALLGRYMLADWREYPCQTVDMSPGGVALVAPVCGQVGERIVAYLDHVGRIEGTLARRIPNGFAMTIAAPLRKRDKLAAQLTWLANRHELGLPEDRRHERIAPKKKQSTLTLSDGREFPCRVIDVSLSGAAIAIEVKPTIGSPVTLGRTLSRVVRHFDGGIGVEFTRPQSLDQLEEQFS